MTLEYAIDDFSIAQLAQAVGDQHSIYETMMRRGQNWQYLFNPATGYVQARNADGSFPPGPAFQTSTVRGRRAERIRGGQRHPVHLVGPAGSRRSREPHGR